MKKKVLLLNSSFYPSIGGVENSLRSLSECLSEKGFDVVVVTGSNKQEKNPPKKEMLFGAEVIRYKTLPFFLHFFSCLITLYRLKRKVRFDVVISRSHIVTLAAMLLGYSDIKYIASGIYRHRNKSDVKTFIGKFRYIMNLSLEEFVLKKLSCIYVFSDSMVSQIKQIDHNIKVIKINPGIDINRFRNTINKDIRMEVGVKNDDVLLLFLGRVESVKQPQKAISSLEYLPSKYKLLIVGNGSELKSCKKLVGELGLNDRVFFRDFSDTPEYYYSAANYFLMSSSYESFGQVILESLASGTPVVAFDSLINSVNTATRELSRSFGVEGAFVFAEENSAFSLAEACLKANPLKSSDLLKIERELRTKWSWFNVFESVNSL